MTGEPDQKEGGLSKWKMALGAASLFFFVVGVKRSFRTDDGREILKSDAERFLEDADEAPPPPSQPRRRAPRKDPRSSRAGSRRQE